MKDAQTGTVESLNLRPIPAGAVVESVKLDAAEKQRVIDGVAQNLKESYVYPDLAQKMEDAVSKAGDYDTITDGGVARGQPRQAFGSEFQSGEAAAAR